MRETASGPAVLLGCPHQTLWLSQPEVILALLRGDFPESTARIAWGKIHFLGYRATENDSRVACLKESVPLIGPG